MLWNLNVLKSFCITSHSVGSFAEYATVEGWFSKGSIYAEGENNHDDGKSEGETSRDHIDVLIYLQLKQWILYSFTLDSCNLLRT